MVHSPGDRNCGEAKAGETSRSIPTPFLIKTYQIVDDPALDDFISWNKDGSAFVVGNPTEFARDLLPRYFKHNNFSSFVRQLNTYGFRKVVSDRWEFSNECFRKDEKILLGGIHRLKVGAAMVVAAVPEQELPRISVSGTNSGEDQVVSSTCSPGVVLQEGSSPDLGLGLGSGSGYNADVIRENDRLRKDNLRLNKELLQMKSMCNNIYSLMYNYSNNWDNSSKGSESVGTPMPASLDLMSAGQCSTEAEETNNGGVAVSELNETNTGRPQVLDEANAKLFGVSIGMKRGREEYIDGVAEHGNDGGGG